MKKIILSLTSLLSLGIFSFASAQIVGVDFNNYDGQNTTLPGAFELDISTITGTLEDPGLQSVAFTSTFATGADQSGFYRFQGETVPTTQTTGGPYIEFTLAPTIGNQFSLDAADSIQFNSRTYDTDDTSAGIFIASSLDGYSTTYLEKGAFSDSKVRSFDLGTGFSSISTPATFRIYSFDPDGSAGIGLRNNGNIIGNYDFVVNGSVSAIPEPSSLALVALALAAGIGLLRRRR